MGNKTKDSGYSKLFVLLMLYLLQASACHTTKYLKGNQLLLRRNSVSIRSDKVISRKTELKDNLQHIEAQKPNSAFLGIPFKLLIYNKRYRKYAGDTSNPHMKTKSVEKPSVYDTALTHKTLQDMKSYMYNQGYFYARVSDSLKIKKQKAFVNYIIDVGENYLINNVNYDVDDTNIAKILKNAAGETGLTKDKEFAMSQLDEERGRIALLLRNNGYYKFSQENVDFVLDTVNKTFFHDVESPFESAVNFIVEQKSNKKPTVDIMVIIRRTDDSLAYTKYSIGNITVYPDFKDVRDFKNKALSEKRLHGLLFRYHTEYVHAEVIARHIYLEKGQEYMQSEYDRTISKLNELGVFQYMRINFTPDPSNETILNCTILLNRTKKLDFSTNYELSNGSTYTLGHTLGLTYMDKNLAKGANLFTISVNGGIETIFDNSIGNNFFDHFFILTKFYGVTGSIDFPKFIAPVSSTLFTNVPHTIISVGDNLMDRVNYFTLSNVSANFSYNWHQKKNITWNLSPVFINIIRLPYESDSFKNRLDSNVFLKDSYKQNFIEGENISFTFTDIVKKRAQNYNYLRLGAEEAGALLSGFNKIGTALNDLYNIKYAQYMKFDMEAKHYFTLPHSTFVMRMLAGIGIPYGQSDALPYVKQYFVGGPYDLRGWRIRSLGPGSYYNPSTVNINYIDQTGDIKLEANAEYRFFIVNMFQGSIKFNGAFFTDAGNIWLYKKDAATPNGEFDFGGLGQEIAADMGTGARFDIASLFTIRFDAAFPIKKPYVFTNEGWVINQIAFADPSWRANNIVLNLSINYPF